MLIGALVFTATLKGNFSLTGEQIFYSIGTDGRWQFFCEQLESSAIVYYYIYNIYIIYIVNYIVIKISLMNDTPPEKTAICHLYRFH